jgi:hypothetical protein
MEDAAARLVAIGDTDSQFLRRQAATGALGEIGPRARAALPWLVRSFVAGDVSTKAEVSRALERVDPQWGATAEAVRAVSDLTAQLEGRIPEQRRLAAWALGRIGPPAHGAVLELVVARLDSTPGVRDAASVAVAAIDPQWARQEDAWVVIPAAEEALLYGDVGVRLAAWQVLREMGRLETVPTGAG